MHCRFLAGHGSRRGIAVEFEALGDRQAYGRRWGRKCKWYASRASNWDWIQALCVSGAMKGCTVRRSLGGRATRMPQRQCQERSGAVAGRTDRRAPLLPGAA